MGFLRWNEELGRKEKTRVRPNPKLRRTTRGVLKAFERPRNEEKYTCISCLI